MHKAKPVRWVDTVRKRLVALREMFLDKSLYIISAVSVPSYSIERTHISYGDHMSTVLKRLLIRMCRRMSYLYIPNDIV